MIHSIAVRSIWLAVAVATLPSTGHGQRALVLYGQGAHYTPLSKLAEAGDNIRPQFGFGGGIALQVSAKVALRASGTFVAARYHGAQLALSDSSIGRTYAMGDLQFGWPGTTLFVPYLVIGGGIVHNDFRDAAVSANTSAAGRLGAGINHLTPIGPLFVETLLTIYRWDAEGFDRAQLDLAVHAGLAVALRL